MAEPSLPVMKPLPPGFQRTMVIVTALFISLMAAIDLTIVTVALPYMAGSLDATSDDVTWVVTMFAVGQAIVIGITGHLTRLMGRFTLILTSVIGFVATSIACGLAQDLDTIVLFRFVQGLFSGPLIPLSQSMLIDAVEEDERAKIMSFWIIGVMGGPAIGPLLGGYLAEDLDWRWNFWVNLPVGAVAVFMILTFVRRTKPVPVQTDWFGLIVLLLTLSSLQIALNQGDKLDWLSSHLIVHLFLLAAVGGVIFFVRGLYLGERHIINIGLFRDLNFTLCCVFVTVISSGFLALLILTPILFVDLIGWQPSSAGMVIGCYGLGGITGSFISGRLQAFLTFRQIYIMGCCVMASGWWWFSGLNENIGMWQGVPAGVLVVFGMFLVFPVLAARAFSKLPPHMRDEGAGLFNLTKTLGFSFGTTFVGTLYYNGQLENWSRYVGNINPANPALQDYLDALGTNVSDDVKMAYVSTLLQEQAQLLTIFQIGQYLTFFVISLLVLAIFFGDKKDSDEPGWFRRMLGAATARTA